MPGMAHRRRPFDVGDPHPRPRQHPRRHPRGVLAATELGYTSILVSYRNTTEGPRAGAGRSTLGDTEMADVDEAIGYGFRRGARQTVFVGWSTGAALVLDLPVLDWTARSADLTTPTLILRGTRDESVPIQLSQALRHARPDLVELESFDAGHTLSWNSDPDRWQEAVTTWLQARVPR